MRTVDDMHEIVMEEFESHLSGNASRAFYDHLDRCAPCRAEVSAMDEVSALFSDFKPAGDVPEPSIGFYQRVSRRIVESENKQVWGLFSPGAEFFRRIAFASLLLLAMLGGFLVTHESAERGTDVAVVMAQHDVSVEHPASADRDRLMVTLASYRQ